MEHFFLTGSVMMYSESNTPGWYGNNEILFNLIRRYQFIFSGVDRDNRNRMQLCDLDHAVSIRSVGSDEHLAILLRDNGANSC